MAKQVCNFAVIGGDCGGVAAVNRSASHGARVVLFEPDRLGGTCVNRGFASSPSTIQLVPSAAINSG